MPESRYTVREAAAYLDLKPETIRYHVYQSKRLKGEWIDSRTLGFTQEELDIFKASDHKSGPKRKTDPHKGT